VLEEVSPEQRCSGSLDLEFKAGRASPIVNAEEALASTAAKVNGGALARAALFPSGYLIGTVLNGCAVYPRHHIPSFESVKHLTRGYTGCVPRHIKPGDRQFARKSSSSGVDLA
jgi:hypothetical protein